MRCYGPAVLQLERWGLLGAVVDAGTPGQDEVVFHYGDASLQVTTSRRSYAPRRTVSIPSWSTPPTAAELNSGSGSTCTACCARTTVAVVGVRARDRNRRKIDLHARVTIGADGRLSRIAKAVTPEVTHRGTATSAYVYGYWSGVSTSGYEWGFRPGSTAGLIPKNDGLVCVFVRVPPRRFAAELRFALAAGLDRVLAETTPPVWERVAAGRRNGPLWDIRACPDGCAGRRAPAGVRRGRRLLQGPHHRHGITDALRDVELAAAALHRALPVDRSYSAALARYGQVRDELSLPLFDATETIAGFRWTLEEVQRRHLDMCDAKRDVEVLSGMGSPDAYSAA